MQLWDSLDGHAGITQETQLLFSSFLDLPSLETSGLMVKRGSSDFKKLPKGSASYQINEEPPHRAIKQLSDFIIAYKTRSPLKTKLSALDIMSLSRTILFLNTLTTLGRSIPLEYFAGKGFENFIWDIFFSNMLDAKEFKKITNAPFRTLRYSTTLMQLASLFAVAYPKINTKGYDIFLAQTPFPARVADSTQMVIRYHDAIPLFAPHLTSFAKFHQLFHYRALKLNAKKAIFACTSEYTRNDLLRIFPTLENRSCVIHDMVSDHYFKEEKSRHSLATVITSRALQSNITLSNKPFPYLLMVSTLDPRKNHSRLIQAWEIIRMSEKLNLKLIIVGKLGYDHAAIVEAIKPWQERGEIFHLQKVQPSELRLLYKEADCVVCPSLLEGFDLTGIEAMLCGGKVAASNIAVHREIYGDAAVYFDPYSVAEQANAIESIILPDHASFAKSLSEKGHQWAQRYKRDAIVPQWEYFFEHVQATSVRAINSQVLPAYGLQSTPEKEMI